MAPWVDQDQAAQIAADRAMDVDMVHEGSILKCPVDDSDVELRELLNVLTRDAADEIKQHEKDILGFVTALGVCSSQYQRERDKSMRAIVSEVYSPP